MESKTVLSFGFCNIKKTTQQKHQKTHTQYTHKNGFNPTKTKATTQKVMGPPLDWCRRPLPRRAGGSKGGQSPTPVPLKAIHARPGQSPPLRVEQLTLSQILLKKVSYGALKLIKSFTWADNGKLQIYCFPIYHNPNPFKKEIVFKKIDQYERGCNRNSTRRASGP